MVSSGKDGELGGDITQRIRLLEKYMEVSNFRMGRMESDYNKDRDTVKQIFEELGRLNEKVQIANVNLMDRVDGKITGAVTSLRDQISSMLVELNSKHIENKTAQEKINEEASKERRDLQRIVAMAMGAIMAVQVVIGYYLTLGK